tara:strand:- start:219 stop:440 length:222 start_codon:yes stop_codon:yes gene_type:complete
MNTIKILKNKNLVMTRNEDDQSISSIWKPHTIGDLPSNFGCVAFTRDSDGEITKKGISEWLKWKGLIYLKQKA